MIAALLLSGALAAQAGDPYAVLSEDAASVCRQGDAAMSEGRTGEAVSLLGVCNQVIIAHQDLSASDRYPLQAHVAKRIATAYAQAGDHDAAASYARFAERFEQMAVRAPDLNRIAEAEAAYEAGDYQAAEDIWLVLLAEAESGENLTGSVHERLYQLGRTLLPQGRADEARAILERAMFAMADAEDAPDPRYLTALAEAYFDLGRYEDSAAILRPLYEGATGVARATYGNNLARALDGAGLYAEAETLLQARVAEARFRDGQPFASRYALARVLFNLARNLAAQGEDGEAGALFAEAAALTVARRPQGHTDIIAAHSFLARHRLLAEDDAPEALSASRTLSANLNAYLSGSAGEIDRSQPIQNAGAPSALFTLHVEAAWGVAAGGQG